VGGGVAHGPAGGAARAAPPPAGRVVTVRCGHAGHRQRRRVRTDRGDGVSGRIARGGAQVVAG
jgi:hypothetical protein